MQNETHYDFCFRVLYTIEFSAAHLILRVAAIVCGNQPPAINFIFLVGKRS